MRMLAATVLLILCSRSLAEEETLRGFIDALQKPVVLDIDAQRSRHPKGRIHLDQLVIYGLRDSGGRRFCVSYYGHYGERWLTERKLGLFVVIPRPIEHFGWDGDGAARHSPEETEIAKMLADALHTDHKAFLSTKK